MMSSKLILVLQSAPSRGWNRWSPLVAAWHICANFATCSWEPLTMLNPHFVTVCLGSLSPKTFRLFFNIFLLPSSTYLQSFPFECSKCISRNANQGHHNDVEVDNDDAWKEPFLKNAFFVFNLFKMDDDVLTTFLKGFLVLLLHSHSLSNVSSLSTFYLKIESSSWHPIGMQLQIPSLFGKKVH